MVNSITFDLHGEHNYITAPKTKTVLKKGKTKGQYEKALAEYEESKNSIDSFLHRRRWYSKSEIENAFFEEIEDGYSNPQLVNNLKDRTIEFSKDKINLIFGPNASGKTTILRAIAANAMCGNSNHFDGFTNPIIFDPLDVTGFRYKEEYPYEQTSKNVYELVNQDAFDDITNMLKKVIDKKAGNGAVIDWDGSLVYYENFAGRKSYGDIGSDFEGSIMGSLGESLNYYMNANSISMGQRTMYLFSKIVNAIKNGYNVQTAIDNAEQKIKKVNSTWYNTSKVQIEFLKSKYRVPEGEQEMMTFMFDEIDKSLDILNVIALYRDVLPDIRKRYPVQIILISHNPIVLSTLLKSDDYNIISIDEKYTADIKKTLSGISY